MYRIIAILLLAAVFTSCAAELSPQSCRVRYDTDSVGGTIYGDTDQSVLPGEEGKPVSVMAKKGFVFEGWDDGSGTVSENAVHWAENVTESLEITAKFRQVHDDIPLISIDTQNNAPIASKEDYVRCSVTVSDPDDGENSFVCSADIRGRGNASWNFPKKSYKIKFPSGLNLLGTGKAEAKDWTLISCYGDQTLLRNYAACRLGELFEHIEWSPACSFAEVYLNGDYLGVYMVTDQVEENEDRVFVDESIEDELDRDYFFELDMYADGEKYVDQFYCGAKPYSIKSDVTAEQGEFLSEFMKEADDAVQSGDRDRIAEYIDIPSLVDMYLLQEYSKNIDVGWSSMYMLKKAGGKIYYTAPWDFDLAFGNDMRLDAGSADGVYAGMGRSGFGQNNLWFIELWKQTWFKELLAERWSEIGGILDQVSREVRELGNALDAPMKRNYEKWDVLTSRTHQQPDAVLENDTYREHVGYMLDWMKDRRAFMDRVLTPYLKKQNN